MLGLDVSWKVAFPERCFLEWCCQEMSHHSTTTTAVSHWTSSRLPCSGWNVTMSVTTSRPCMWPQQWTASVHWRWRC